MRRYYDPPVTRLEALARRVALMRDGRRVLWFSTVLILFAFAPARAQYIYLDVNGNGVNDAGDVLSTTGPTTLTVWLDTATNRDGTPAVVLTNGACWNYQLPSIAGYAFVLHADGGTLAWGPYSDSLSAYTGGWTAPVTGTDFASPVFWCADRPPGLYKLGALTASIATGRPHLSFRASSTYFNSSYADVCWGLDYDFMLKLGSDWLDSNGVGSPPGTNTPPSIIGFPRSAAGAEGAPISISAVATDPDAGQTISVRTVAPPFLAQAGGGPGVPPVDVSLTGTPSYSDSGTYAITWIVVDDAAEPESSWVTTTLAVANTDRAPVVTAPATEVGAEGSLVTFHVSASDPDDDPVRIDVNPLPPNASLEPDVPNQGATFIWLPDFTQAGTYPLTFTCGPLASAVTVVTINNVDRAPVVVAPHAVTGNENSLIDFLVSASDADSEAIDTITAAPLPDGATFTRITPTSGCFTWTPSYAQAGTYSVDFAASNSLEGSSATVVTVNDVDRPPTVSGPSDVIGEEGTLLSFEVTASDPDGDPIDALGASVLPGGASFTVDSTRASGGLNWLPDFTQSGYYSVEISARSSRRAIGVSGIVDTVSLLSSITVAIRVDDTNRAPVVTAPDSISGLVASMISFPVSAVDPDGDAVTLTATDLPVGATFGDLGNGTGVFAWTPSYSQAGTYSPTFMARDMLQATSPARVVFMAVEGVNRPPVSEPGGPYAGLAGAPLTVDGSGSFDPDGDQVSFAWIFGDGAVGVGSAPSHVYAVAGTYSITLTVTDGALSSAAQTSATVQDALPARSFTVGGNGTIRLGSGRPAWCAQVEPQDGSFSVPVADQRSIVLRYGDSGAPALVDKAAVRTDADRNGVDELGVCFAKTDLRDLFRGVPAGRSTVTVVLEGNLLTGGRFRSELAVDVVSGGPGLAPSVSPNPLNPDAILTFHTAHPGPVRVMVFDLNGRVVRTLSRGSQEAAGYHDLRIDGRDDSGQKLASGVYLYRIESADGFTSGRFVVLK